MYIKSPTKTLHLGNDSDLKTLSPRQDSNTQSSRLEAVVSSNDDH
jgi:hypothetical protein